MIDLAKPSLDAEEEEAVHRVLRSGWLVQGPEVEAFEKDLARLHQVSHAIAVSSGTAALHVAALVLGIGPGQALFVPSFAWPSAPNTAARTGARVVFVDVLPGTYNLDPADLRRRLQECHRQKWGAPRLIVPVHQFGLAAEMDEVMAIASEFSTEVLEDAACALGATYRGSPVGRKGRLGVLSFHPRKAVTTGEGGAILTDDTDLAERCRQWRNHGQVLRDGKRDFVVSGLNYRLTDLQAAIGRVQLRKLPAILQRRRDLAARYRAGLDGIPGFALPQHAAEHTWQTYMAVVPQGRSRDRIQQELASRGIGAAPGSVAGHCLQVYKDTLGYREDNLPVSRLLQERGLALPLHARMTDEEADTVVRETRQVLSPGAGTRG
jgi:perosamine synthetase